MTTLEPFATPDDVADIWRPLSAAELGQVSNLIDKVSAKLRQKTPFDIDARVSLYATDPASPLSLDPLIVADVTATIVKRFLVNTDGAATVSEGVGPYSRSATYVNRYDKTGSDVRGAIQVTDSDIAQLRPAIPTFVAGSIRTRPADRVFPLGPAGPVDDVALRNRVLERRAVPLFTGEDGRDS